MSCRISATRFTKAFPTLRAGTLLSGRFLSCLHSACMQGYLCVGYVCASLRLTLDAFLDRSSYCLSRQGLSLHLELSVSVLAIYPACLQDSLSLCPRHWITVCHHTHLASMGILGTWTPVLKLARQWFCSLSCVPIQIVILYAVKCAIPM